ncbi:MAG: hypothetical protein WCG87_09640 [Bacteroidota bacterium]
MKLFRSIALTAALTIGAFTAVTYTACNKDACKNVTCNNGGTCSGGNCTCVSGYEGTTCDSLTRNKYLTGGTIASWKTGIGEDSCYSPGYMMTIAPGANNDEIIINNFAGYGVSSVVTGVKVSGLTFTKTGTVTVGAVTLSSISGSINSAGTQITFTYHAVDTSSSITCSGKATKQ